MERSYSDVRKTKPASRGVRNRETQPPSLNWYNTYLERVNPLAIFAKIIHEMHDEMSQLSFASRPNTNNNR